MMNDDNILITEQKSIRADAARNRENLLETARRLFDEQGVEEVTMSSIAKEAHVGKGTLYRHFADKAEVCHALLDDGMRKFQERTLLYLRNDIPPCEKLKWFLQEAVQFVVSHTDLLLEAANQGSGDMLHHPAHLWWRQTIRGLLTQLQPDGDLDYMADVFYVLLDVQAIVFQRQTQGYSIDRIVDGINMTVDRLAQAG